MKAELTENTNIQNEVKETEIKEISNNQEEDPEQLCSLRKSS